MLRQARFASPRIERRSPGCQVRTIAGDGRAPLYYRAQARGTRRHVDQLRCSRWRCRRRWMRFRNRTHTNRWEEESSYEKDWISRSSALLELFGTCEATEGTHYDLAEY